MLFLIKQNIGPTCTHRRVRTILKLVRLKWGLGIVPPAGIKGAEPLCGGQGVKPLEGSAFSEMRLEFVHQVDGTIITKLFMFIPFF